MWVYVLVGLFVLFALYKERQALGCPNIPDGSDCNNAEGKAIKGTRPVPSDPTPTVFNKIDAAARFADRWVMWRVGVIVAVPILLVMWWILYQRIPSEVELLTGMVVITSMVYFAFSFYKFHLIDYARNNIEKGVEILASRQ